MILSAVGQDVGVDGVIDAVSSLMNRKPKGATRGKKNDERSEERRTLLVSRLAVAKAFSKKAHARWKKYLAEYEIEDVEDVDEVRDKVRIGYLFRKTEGDLPSIFETQPELFFKTRNQLVKQIQKLIENAHSYLWDIQDLESKIEAAAIYFIVLGQAYIKSPWVTKTKTITEEATQPVMDELTGQPKTDIVTGQPVMETVLQTFEVPLYDAPKASIPNPFKIHFSPETKFSPVLDNETCPYYFEETTMTVEEVEARFGKKIDANETLKIDEGAPSDETENHEQVKNDDLKRVTVYEYYGSLPEGVAPQGTEWEYDKCYHAYITKNEELFVDVSEYAVKPLMILGNYGVQHKFWRFGEAKHLIPLIQELELYRSQILLHTRKMANPKPLIAVSAQVDENAFTDPRVGRMVKYEGPTPPSYLSPAPLGAEVAEGLNEARTDLEKTSGSFDLASGSNQSTVKTPRGIQVFSEAADKAIRSKRKKVARLLRHLIIFQLAQIAQNWDPADPKTIEVLATNDPELVPLVPATIEFLQSDNLMTKIDVEVESLSVNRVQQKQDALALFDQAAQHPEIFNLSEIAKDLLATGYSKRDVERYVYSPEQLAQMQQQQAQAQAEQAQRQMLSQTVTNPLPQQLK